MILVSEAKFHFESQAVKNKVIFIKNFFLGCKIFLQQSAKLKTATKTGRERFRNTESKIEALKTN